MNAIDLGLSVKWSNCNLGASCSEELGNHYAWGEVIPKNIYKLDTYKYYNKTKHTIIYTNNITTIDDKWRLPSVQEWSELFKNCIHKYTESYNNTNVKGIIYTSKINNNSIFFPFAGYFYRYEITLKHVGQYWTNNIFSGAAHTIYDVYLYKYKEFINRDHCYWGKSIRPVLINKT